MPESVIEAIRQGIWDFEPEETSEGDYQQTAALRVAARSSTSLPIESEKGEPLWHPSDRITFRDNDED